MHGYGCFFEPLQLSAAIVWHDAGIGLIVGLAISAVSAAIYRLWPAYQKSADFYLNFVLAPLTLSDSIWVGLLPGMSEETAVSRRYASGYRAECNWPSGL